VHKNLIYDVGMHKGEDTAFYLRKGFDVVAIEANAELCRECSHLFSNEIAAGRLTIIDKAISDTGGIISFFINERHSNWGTASLGWVKRNEARGAMSHEVEVEATTINDVLQQFGTPYYMKIDIEGADILCLSGLLHAEERPRYVSVEASATSVKDTFAQLSQLERLGYTKFKIIPQRTISGQRCPDPAREGVFVDYRFEPGSSGLFGEETPGDWQSLTRVRWRYLRIHLELRLVGSNNGVFRNFPSSSVRRLLRSVFSRGIGWYDTHATW
jgi:FkbM family methyltransferase